MRTIKFRGQREDNKEWVFGGLIDDKYIVGNVIDWNENYFNTEYWWKVIPETVGQFTGLLDKNGTEIYEGDILVCQKWIGGNWIDYCIERGYVEMKLGAFGLHRKQGYYRPFKDWLEDYEFEVIGNIHDNKEET